MSMGYYAKAEACHDGSIAFTTEDGSSRRLPPVDTGSSSQTEGDLEYDGVYLLLKVSQPHHVDDDIMGEEILMPARAPRGSWEFVSVDQQRHDGTYAVTRLASIIDEDEEGTAREAEATDLTATPYSFSFLARHYSRLYSTSQKTTPKLPPQMPARRPAAAALSSGPRAGSRCRCKSKVAFAANTRRRCPKHRGLRRRGRPRLRPRQRPRQRPRPRPRRRPRLCRWRTVGGL